MLNIVPIITKERQKKYEQIYLKNALLNNNIPEICGYYGRACRNMNSIANSMLCNGCSLSVFSSTVEAILEQCDEKENLGIEYLYDSDIFDIQEKLKAISVNVEFSYIEDVLDSLVLKEYV